MTTLLQIRNFALARADMQNSNFRDNTQLNFLINQSINELYDILISKMEDYYVNQMSFTITAPADSHVLGSQVYKIRGVDYNYNGYWSTMHSFMLEDRNRYQYSHSRAVGNYNSRYRWMGDAIQIIPSETAAGDYRIWYIPRLEELFSDADILNSKIEFWLDYIVIDVAIKLLQQEESDVSVLMAQKAAMVQRVESMASNRDAGEPQRVTDIRANEWCDDNIWGTKR